jgi:hypothetical protein
MEPPISPLLFSVLLFVSMLILLETGQRFGLKRRPKESEGERGSLGTIEGAVFALFGLLMAFSFSGAATRFNEKRMLIAEEANMIETAYLRLHLVPEAEPQLQELFRRYVDSRLETYRRLPNMKAASLELAHSKVMQEEIWTEAVAATRLPSSDAAAQYHLCASFRAWAHLFASGRLSHGGQPAAELAAHPGIHPDHSDYRLRHAGRRVPARRPDPARDCRPGAGWGPRRHEVSKATSTGSSRASSSGSPCLSVGSFAGQRRCRRGERSRPAPAAGGCSAGTGTDGFTSSHWRNRVGSATA